MDSFFLIFYREFYSCFNGNNDILEGWKKHGKH